MWHANERKQQDHSLAESAKRGDSGRAGGALARLGAVLALYEGCRVLDRAPAHAQECCMAHLHVEYAHSWHERC